MDQLIRQAEEEVARARFEQQMRDEAAMRDFERATYEAARAYDAEQERRQQNDNNNP